MPTQLKASSFTKRIRRRRRNSEIRRGSACSQNMVVRSTLRSRRRSCYPARRRSMSNTLGLGKSSMGRSERRRDQSTPKMVRVMTIFYLVLSPKVLSQSTSTITRLCGDRGMIQHQVHGAMRVVTLQCTSHTARARREDRLQQRRALRICLWKAAHHKRIRHQNLLKVVGTKGSSGRQTSTLRRNRAN